MWLIALFAVLGSVSAFVFTLRSPPSFEASSTLLIAPGNPPAGLNNAILVADDQQAAATYAQWLTRRPILEGVIAQLNLKATPSALAQEVDVQPVRGTRLLSISVTDNDPERAAAIANELPKVFVGLYHDVQTQRLGTSEAGLLRSLSVTQAQIADIQGQLDATQSTPTSDTAQERAMQTLLTQQQLAYADLLQSYEVVHANDTATQDDIIVVEQASVPVSPVKPNRTLNTLLGAVVGAMLAGGLAFVFESFRKPAHPPRGFGQRQRHEGNKLVSPASPGRVTGRTSQF